MLVKNSLIIFPQLTINTINITSQLTIRLENLNTFLNFKSPLKIILNDFITGIDKKYVIWFS